MKRVFAVAILWAALFAPASPSEDVAELLFLDRILKREVEDGQYFVSFCATSQGRVGHVWVTLSESGETGNASFFRPVYSIGFWPDAGKKRSLQAVFSAAPGRLRDEAKRTDGRLSITEACRFTVPISKEEFELIKIKITAYADDDYALLENDCVTFAESIARDVLRLKVPDRAKLFDAWRREPGALSGFPARYVRELCSRNAKN